MQYMYLQAKKIIASIVLLMMKFANLPEYI